MGSGAFTSGFSLTGSVRPRAGGGGGFLGRGLGEPLEDRAVGERERERLEDRECDCDLDRLRRERERDSRVRGGERGCDGRGCEDEGGELGGGCGSGSFWSSTDTLTSWPRTPSARV